ncbi:uncharacterized protein [Cardiocondyla obscurior]|uniref:uncharacterized protein n=1 Tax=Cardiocondyla obscurior TaxID=286306 RepID=UPI0039657896
MGNLPKLRICRSRPFLNTGIDYAGPVLVRASKGRGQKSHKAFLAIFVCLATRAIHLELVLDYTIEAFIAAFRRFISRRGICATITSDRGINFVGANTELRKFYHDAIQNELFQKYISNHEIRWRFNSPSAPHFGDIWKAAVKATKYHVHRVIGEATLTFKELTTFLTQVESCLNSRPLTALSDDFKDFEALTPGHFLIGEALNSIPETSLAKLPDNRLSRWQLIQKIKDHFWERWSKEYLPSLNIRQKWPNKGKNLKIGMLCLIKGETTSPGKWPLARIIAVYPGKNNQVRVVTLKTATSTFDRPVVKIVPLLSE